MASAQANTTFLWTILRETPRLPQASRREKHPGSRTWPARLLGKERWYSHYELRVAKVERAQAGPEGR